MEYLQWIFLVGLIVWGFWASLRRPPPTSRWKEFAESNGLELQPSTPFASERIRGLWRQGDSGSPIPLAIQILRRSRTSAGGVQLRCQVPSGLPWGLCLDAKTLSEPIDSRSIPGIRTQALARKIQRENLIRPLTRFFEDWPQARVLQGSIQLQISGRVDDIRTPIEAMVELCRALDSRDERTPKDLVIAESLPDDPDAPGALPSATISAEVQALEDSDQSAISLQDWTPFGSPFGLKAPDMAPPPGTDHIQPLPLDAEWALPELSSSLIRQLRALASSQDPNEQRALLHQLERAPLSLSQVVTESRPTRGVFLPPPWRNGQSTIGHLEGVNIPARLLHPRGIESDPSDCPWPVQVVDWDPMEGCLVGHRLPPSGIDSPSLDSTQ